MPIIEAMFVVKTDISIDCETAQMSPPVTRTETNPSTSGSAAAASEPKTNSKISATIEKPTLSAVCGSLLEISCSPAHSAPWPMRCVVTAPSETAGVPISSCARRSLAMSTASYSLPSTVSGMTTVRGSPAPASAAPLTATRSLPAATSRRRAIAAA